MGVAAMSMGLVSGCADSRPAAEPTTSRTAAPDADVTDAGGPGEGGPGAGAGATPVAGDRPASEDTADILAAYGLAAGAVRSTSRPAMPAPRTRTWDEQWADLESGMGDALITTERSLTGSDWDRLTDGAVPLATRVRELAVRETTISEADLARLTRFDRLEVLRLATFPLTDAGCPFVVAVPSLTRLDLPAAVVTETGLARLATLPGLTSLRIGSPNLPEHGLTAIAEAKALRHLHLIDVPLNRDSVEAIVGLPALTSCYLDGANLSDDDLERLITARPDVHLHLDQAHPDRRFRGR